MSGGFRRSSAFGIVGVIVVMITCAVIALQYGSGTARPTGALIVIVAHLRARGRAPRPDGLDAP